MPATLPKRLSGHSSAPLDDEHGLIVNTAVLFANLAETIVFFTHIPAERLQISFAGWRLALTHHPFQLLTFFFVTARRRTPIGIKEENVHPDLKQR